MDSIQAYRLTVILSVTAGELAISLPIVSWWLLVPLAILGWILVALLAPINRSASCKDLSDIGSGSGKTERSK